MWEMRNITDDYKADEFVSMYKELGFEVEVRDFNPKDHPLECNECMIETPEKFKVIYTRQGTKSEEDLFDE